MKTKHSKTPIKVAGPQASHIVDKDGDYYCDVSGWNDLLIQRREHIVKCVNYFDELKTLLRRALYKIQDYEPNALVKVKGKWCHTSQTGQLLHDAKQLLEKLEKETD